MSNFQEKYIIGLAWVNSPVLAQSMAATKTGPHSIDGVEGGHQNSTASQL